MSQIAITYVGYIGKLHHHYFRITLYWNYIFYMQKTPRTTFFSGFEYVL